MHRNLLIAEVLKGKREAVLILSDMLEEEGDYEQAELTRARKQSDRKLLKLGLELVHYPMALRLGVEYFQKATGGKRSKQFFDVLEHCRQWILEWESEGPTRILAARSSWEPFANEPRDMRREALESLLGPMVKDFAASALALPNTQLGNGSRMHSAMLQDTLERWCICVESLGQLIGAAIVEDSRLLRRKNNRLRESLFQLSLLAQTLPANLHHCGYVRQSYTPLPAQMRWQINRMIELLEGTEEA